MFEFDFYVKAWEDFRWFGKFKQNLIGDALEKQLRHQPDVATRKRKHLAPGHVSAWELRIGEIRVFYNVDLEASVVEVVRIGYKERNKLLFRAKEHEP